MTSRPCCWRVLRSGLSRGLGAWLRWVSCMPVCAEMCGRSTGTCFLPSGPRCQALGQHRGLNVCLVSAHAKRRSLPASKLLAWLLLLQICAPLMQHYVQAAVCPADRGVPAGWQREGS